MTFAVVAFCPPNVPGGTSGLAFVTDCRLTTGIDSRGRVRTYRDDAMKIFALSPFCLVAYAGDRFSASVAIRRAARLFVRRDKLPTGQRPLLEKTLWRGTEEAKRLALIRNKKLGGRRDSRFALLVGYLDDAGNFELVVHNPYGKDVGYAGLFVDGEERVVAIGSGTQHMRDFLPVLERITKEHNVPRDAHPAHHAGSIAFAALEVMEHGGLGEFCGGGVQVVILSEKGWEEVGIVGHVLDPETGLPTGEVIAGTPKILNP